MKFIKDLEPIKEMINEYCLSNANEFEEYCKAKEIVSLNTISDTYFEVEISDIFDRIQKVCGKNDKILSMYREKVKEAKEIVEQYANTRIELFYNMKQCMNQESSVRGWMQKGLRCTQFTTQEMNVIYSVYE